MSSELNPLVIGFRKDGRPIFQIAGGSVPVIEDTPASDPNGQAPEDEQETQPEGEGDGEGNEEDSDELSEKAKKELSKLRGEAAGWRKQFRDAQTLLAAAKTPEDFAAVQADFEAKLAAKDREVVLARYPLPEELSALLKGDTAEALEAHAKALSKFVINKPSDDDGDLAGGLSPSDSPDEADDPRRLGKQLRGRVRRF